MPETKTSATKTLPKTLDAVVVGAGFAGLYMLHRLRGLGLHLGLRSRRRRGRHLVLEPLSRRALRRESLEYSLHLLARDSSRTGTGANSMAPQPEIEGYVNHVADRFDLRRDIRFYTRVTDATSTRRRIAGRSRTDRGEAVRPVLHHGDRLPVLTVEAGYRRASKLRRRRHTRPASGRRGRRLHGKRVGIIGTGSSGDPVDPRDRRAGRPS